RGAGALSPVVDTALDHSHRVSPERPSAYQIQVLAGTDRGRYGASGLSEHHLLQPVWVVLVGHESVAFDLPLHPSHLAAPQSIAAEARAALRQHGRPRAKSSPTPLSRKG